MRLRNIRGSKETIAASDYVVQEPETHKEHGGSFLAISSRYRLKWEWERDVLSWIWRAASGP